MSVKKYTRRPLCGVFLRPMRDSSVDWLGFVHQSEGAEILHKVCRWRIKHCCNGRGITNLSGSVTPNMPEFTFSAIIATSRPGRPTDGKFGCKRRCAANVDTIHDTAIGSLTPVRDPVVRCYASEREKRQYIPERSQRFAPPEQLLMDVPVRILPPGAKELTSMEA